LELEDIVVKVPVSELVNVNFFSAEIASGTIRMTITNNLPVTLEEGFEIRVGELLESTQMDDLEPGFTTSFTDDLAGKSLMDSLTFEFSGIRTPGGTDLSFTELSGVTIRLFTEEVRLQEALVTNTYYESDTLIDFQAELQDDLVLKRLLLNEAAIGFEYCCNIPGSTEAELRFLNPFDSLPQFVFQPNLEDSSPVPLQNIDLTLADTNRLLVDTQIILDIGDEPELIVFDEIIRGELVITDINPKFIEGDLGILDQEIGTLLEIDLFDIVRSGNLDFDGISLSLALTSAFGLPATVLSDESVQLISRNPRLSPGTELDLGRYLRGLVFERALDTLVPATQSFTFNRESVPEFDDFFEILPSEIEIMLPVELGSPEVDLDEFIWDNGFVKSSARIDFPVEISASDLVVADTFDLDLNISGENFSVFESTFDVFFRSTLPFELFPQVYFFDQNDLLLDSLFLEEKVLQPAEIDANEVLTRAIIEEFIIEIDAEKLERVEASHYAVIIFRMNTPEGQIVRINTDFEIDFQLVADIRLSIDPGL
jgi:hypothetical protein